MSAVLATAGWTGGWWEAAHRVPSPNCDARPAGCEVEIVVIHAISLPPGEYGGPYVLDLFLDRLDCTRHPYFAGLAGLRVSAHFLIARDGRLSQFVSADERAWHAGISAWRGRAACNDFSLGIELEGSESEPFAETQYATLAPLLAALARRYPCLSSERLVGHSDIAPGRKRDPGPHFDWARARRSLPA